MLIYLPSCYSALSFLRAHCSYILLKKNYFKAFSLFFSLKNIFYFSLFLKILSFFSVQTCRFSLLLFTFFFFFLTLWNRSPCGSTLEAISRLGFEPMKLLPFQFFFSVGFYGGSRWRWFVGLNWRHGGEIGQCVGWIFGLQFCFDGWLFLLDGCGFASFFFFFSSFYALVQHISLSPFGLPRVAVFACQLFFVLWWLVVILVDGCGYTLCFFLFLFFLQVVVVAKVVLWLVVVVAMVGCGCYNGGYGKWSGGRGGGGGGCYSFLCSCFIIILTSRQPVLCTGTYLFVR